MPAIVVGGIIAAAGSVGGALISAHAAHEAANQEVAAGTKALNLQTQQFQAGQQALAPYQFGGPAMSGLNYHVGTQPPQGGGGMPPAGGAGPAPTLGGLAGYGGGMSATPTSAPAGMPGQGGAGTVLLQAPTGETRRVPQDQAQRYVALGAKVIG
jgi:hypothetical protein